MFFPFFLMTFLGLQKCGSICVSSNVFAKKGILNLIKNVAWQATEAKCFP